MGHLAIVLVLGSRGCRSSARTRSSISRLSSPIRLLLEDNLVEIGLNVVLLIPLLQLVDFVGLGNMLLQISNAVAPLGQNLPSCIHGCLVAVLAGCSSLVGVHSGDGWLLLHWLLPWWLRWSSHLVSIIINDNWFVISIHVG